MFDLFAQADRTLDRAKGGLGLGLTLVRRLIEMHHGTVEAFSAGLDQGSQFVLRLPVLASTAAETPAAEPVAAPRAAHSRRVLVVDDDVDAAESLAMVLRMNTHDVRTAHDGKTALEAAERNAPEVVILDIGLPDNDGCDVARSLRALAGTAGALLIAVTGYGQPDDVARSMAAGFDHHLVKPADPDRIAALIDAWKPKGDRARSELVAAAARDPLSAG